MTVTRKDLCEAFKRSAAGIYDLISFSYSRSTLGVSEEAITEIMLVELDRSLSPYIATIKFNKREEGAASGADWLWTIGRPGRWFSLLVQAKLARPTSQTLQGLHHGNGEQLANLVSYARKEGCFPVYAVYNNRSAESSEHKCGTIRMDPRQMGSVLVRAGHVATMYRRARNATSVRDVLAKSLPWACLFDCPNEAFESDELADAVAASVAKLPVRAELNRSMYRMVLDGLAPNVRKRAQAEGGPNDVGSIVRNHPDGLLSAEGASNNEIGSVGREESRSVVRRPRKAKRVWLANEPDDFVGIPESLLSERPPEIVQSILRGDEVRTSEVGMVSIISTDPINVRKYRA